MSHINPTEWGVERIALSGDGHSTENNILHFPIDDHWVRVNKAYKHWWVGCLYNDCDVYIKAIPQNDCDKVLIVRAALQNLGEHICGEETMKRPEVISDCGISFKL